MEAKPFGAEAAADQGPREPRVQHQDGGSAFQTWLFHLWAVRLPSLQDGCGGLASTSSSARVESDSDSDSESLSISGVRKSAQSLWIYEALGLFGRRADCLRAAAAASEEL